jgi:NAD dependent epimerase/dehydratase family enzyme
MRTFLFSLLLAVPAFAQEPSKPITPAEPITTVRTHEVTAISSDCTEKPVILPTPLPALRISLGEYARQIRAQHAAAPKAAKTVDTDQIADATEGK